MGQSYLLEADGPFTHKQRITGEVQDSICNLLLCHVIRFMNDGTIQENKRQTRPKYENLSVFLASS